MKNAHLINNSLVAFTNFLDRVVRGISVVLHSLAMFVLALMMFLSVADVFGRYFFNSPIPGAYEIIKFMMATIVSCGLALCAIEKQNIVVDVLMNMFSQRMREYVAIPVTFCAFAFLVLLSWVSFIYINDMRLVLRSTSEILHIPSYPFVGLVFLGIAVLTLVSFVDFLKTIAREVK